MTEQGPVPGIDLARLKRTMLRRFGLAVLILAAMLFLPAGTLRFWQAWVFLAVLLIPMGGVVAYFLKKSPEMLERRLRTKEREPEQKAIVLWSYPFFLAAYLLPGFDRRCGWSAVPAALTVAADAAVLAAYLFFARVMRENRFLSRTVETDRGQEVIRTGPYAVVRHPMYAAVIPLYLAGPLALGSYWALLPAAAIPVLIVLRILNEEKVLERELPGYKDYRQQVKFRLIPGVW
jgi:protein-S-isoprenylcysteine O-methyltransferase Ste14